MSTTTSRRNALALVATLPALAAPAAVAAMGLPDAELIRLGEQQDRDARDLWEAAAKPRGYRGLILALV